MKKVLIIGTITAILGGAVYLFYKKQIDQLSKLKYAFLKVSLGNLGATDTVLNLSLMVTSESTLEAEITDLNLEVFLNEKKVGSVSEIKPIILPAKGSSVVDLKISITPLQAGMDLLSAATSYLTKKDANIKINGYGKVKSAFIKTSVPFTYETTLKQIIHK